MLNPDKLNPDIFCRPGKKCGDIGDSGDKRMNTGVSVSPLLKTLRGQRGQMLSPMSPLLKTSWGHVKPALIPAVPVVPPVPV